MKNKMIFAFVLGLFLSVPSFSKQEVTFREKIGQMIMLGFDGSQLNSKDEIVQAILNQEVGGVILFDYNFKTKKFDKNIENPKQLAKLTNSLQSYAKTAAQKKGNHLYPLLISIDYEGGERGTRLQPTKGFPKTLPPAEIAKMKPKIAKQYAETMAKTLKQVGVNMNFAPALDVNVNPNNPVIGKIKRSFSKNPKKVIKYATIFSKAYHKEGILCAHKHFPGHGSSRGDTHEGFVDVSKTWKKKELKPYRVLLSKSYACPMVMNAHVVHSGLSKEKVPSTLSKTITQNLLREQLKFKGVVVTDDMQMKAITSHYGLEKALKLVINAGADILIFGNQLQEGENQKASAIIEIILKAVKKGEISKQRIDEAYNRVMDLKKRI